MSEEKKVVIKDGITVLPDGSAFATGSFPLPKNHWLYEDKFNVPPMKMRMGTDERCRQDYVDMIKEAGRYAVRCATMNGKDDDFDPDALVQSLVIGLLGYFTPDGLSNDDWANPNPIPTIWSGDVPKKKG